MLDLIDLGAHSLGYRLDGAPGAPAVVFINSLSSDHRMWDAQIPALEGEFRILRFDARGHGQSDVPPGPYSADLMADDLAALLTRLEIVGPVHVVGLSLGGMVAMAFASRYPERVARLVLCATTDNMAGGEAIWNDRIAKTRAGGTAAFAPDTIARWFTPAFLAERDDKVAPIRDQIVATPDEGYIAAAAAVRDVNLSDRLAALTMPTLAIAASEDPVTPPAMMQDLVDRLPNARLEIVGPASHLLNVEQPEAFNTILRAFLAGA
ncbi:3-oxoadipate enol-lactonase [Marinibacterium profundimaris]|uniref:3-oxoadipate enol-lactonase n=1 Tax=Marinibacterium profundimaris TaxID=1679460 RepID=UPI000B523831|nr:3-oxoadipate enol-lactonase [Marinibacterium profundimaris]